MQNDISDTTNTLTSTGISTPNNMPEGKQYQKAIVNGKKIYTCLFSECSKKFKFKSEIKRHLTTHSNQRPFTCTYTNCCKSFKRADALQSHMTVHTAKAVFTCPVQKCSSEFNTKSALQYHLLKHKGEKVYKCSHPGCYKSFLTFSHLKQHESAVGFHQKLQLTDSPNPFFAHMQLLSLAETMTDVSLPKEESEDDYNRSDYSGLNNYKTLDPIKFEEDEKPSTLNIQRFHLDVVRPQDSFNPYEVLQKKRLLAKPLTTLSSGSEFKESLFDVFVFLKKENQELEKKLKLNMSILQNNLVSYSSPLRTYSETSKSSKDVIQTKIESEEETKCFLAPFQMK